MSKLLLHMRLLMASLCIWSEANQRKLLEELRTLERPLPTLVHQLELTLVLTLWLV